MTCLAERYMERGRVSVGIFIYWARSLNKRRTRARANVNWDKVIEAIIYLWPDDELDLQRRVGIVGMVIYYF